MNCRNCGATQESPEGVIDFSEDGYCENCVEQQEYARILDESEREYGDFDFSMNY